MKKTMLFVLAVALVAAPAMASHSWGGYHWARSSNPVQLTLGDNFKNPAYWTTAYNTAVSDWNQSTVLSLTKVAGGTTSRKCSAATGKIEVCADSYGNNGWLGLASISVSGLHITKATTKLNNSYYTSGSTYDTAAWRALVMCQEIGHDFGLDHQDTNFNNANLGTCMDYTNDPSTNQHPNQHDYDELATIYGHTDLGLAPTKAQQAPPAMDQLSLDGPGQWGQLVFRSEDGHKETYVLDFGGGHKIITHVLWAQGYSDLDDNVFSDQ